MPTIAAEQLRSFAGDLLAAGGFDSADATAMADLLVWANLRGIDSHGVLRVPRYIEMLEQNLVKTGRAIREARRFGAICILDADFAPGARAMLRAVEEASALAATFGLGWCGVRRTSHAGAIGYFAEKLTNEGKIAIVMTASKPLMGYYGAKGEALSSNPLAIGVPQADGRPAIILDMSTAAVALGKIMSAKDAGTLIPIGWGVDAAGGDTTDPHAVTAVLPMAGAKGSGLSLMIEVLCSVLSGNPNIAPALLGGKSGSFNGMVLAIDPAAFGDPDQIIADVRSLADAIHGLDPAPGVDRVLLPGERGYAEQLTRSRDGIPVAAGTAKRLRNCAESLGLPIPAALAANT